MKKGRRGSGEVILNGGKWPMRGGQHEAKREEKVTLGFCTVGTCLQGLGIRTCGNWETLSGVHASLHMTKAIE